MATFHYYTSSLERIIAVHTAILFDYRMPPTKRGRKKANQGPGRPPKTRRQSNTEGQATEQPASTRGPDDNREGSSQLNLANIASIQEAVAESVTNAMKMHITQAVQQELAKLVSKPNQTETDGEFTLPPDNFVNAIGQHQLQIQPRQTAAQMNTPFVDQQAGTSHGQQDHANLRQGLRGAGQTAPQEVQQGLANLRQGLRGAGQAAPQEVQQGHANLGQGPRGASQAAQDYQVNNHMTSSQTSMDHTTGLNGQNFVPLVTMPTATGAGQGPVPLWTAGSASNIPAQPNILDYNSYGKGQNPVLLNTSLYADQKFGEPGDYVPMSLSLPLDYAVTPEIKTKIWSNQYIEFGELLHPTQTAQMKVAVQKDGNGDSTLCLIQGNKKLPKSITEWNSAFAIFTTVYTAKFPTEIGGLLKYAENIRQIALEEGNFNWYDVTFRKWRQTKPLPWGGLVDELYFRATKQKVTKLQNDKDRLGASQFPSGTCFRFHGKQFCDGSCGYPHKCFRCHGGHPIYKCWQKEGGRNQERRSGNYKAWGRGDAPSTHNQNPQGGDRYHYTKSNQPARGRGAPNRRDNANKW